MRNIFIVILLVINFPYNIIAQCSPTYSIGANVYTCKGAVINTIIPSCEFSPQQKADIKASVLAEYGSKGITNNDILDDASSYYNCHAYAWHLGEGNTNRVWINAGTNNTNISSTLTD